MATLLILLMVIGLSFVLFTANIGNVSVQSTAIANAADAAALQLSSNLSTKSRQLFEGLGNTVKDCTETGFAAMGFAIIGAIALLVVSFGSAAPAIGGWFTTALGGSQMLAMTAVGAIGGAAGGAIGGEYAGTGAGRGALMGAGIGAAIGGMAAGITGAETGKFTEIALVGENASAMGAASISVPITAGLSQIVVGGLGVASTAYNEAERMRAIDDYINEIMKMLSKASEKDSMTQMTIMRAMSGVVDDPNMSPDVNDTNYNRDTTELVSDYQAWWWQRAKNIPKVDSNSIANALLGLDGLLAFIGGILGGGYGWAPDLLVSKEYMWPTDLSLPAAQLDILLPGKDPEGLLAHSFRALEGSGVDLSFWEPGPQYDVYTAAYAHVPSTACTGAACDVPPPPGYDRFDMAVASLHEAYIWVSALRQQSPSALAATWDHWINLVYDPAEDALDDPAYNPYTDPPSSIYGILTLVIYEMNSWMAEIDALYPTWPPCQMNAYGEFVTAPCRTTFSSWWQDASFDTVPDYEYSQVKSWLGTWGPMLLDFMRSVLKGMANYGYLGNEIRGGKNPATYEWNDARGRHRVRVKVGNFRIPNIVKREYGNWWKGKTCLELESYSDNWEFTNLGKDENYVEVSRYDQPSGQAAIGRWNPLNRSITKRAYYSYGLTWDDVHLRHRH